MPASGLELIPFTTFKKKQKAYLISTMYISALYSISVSAAFSLRGIHHHPSATVRCPVMSCSLQPHGPCTPPGSSSTGFYRQEYRSGRGNRWEEAKFLSVRKPLEGGGFRIKTPTSCETDFSLLPRSTFKGSPVYQTRKIMINNFSHNSLSATQQLYQLPSKTK